MLLLLLPNRLLFNHTFTWKLVLSPKPKLWFLITLLLGCAMAAATPPTSSVPSSGCVVATSNLEQNLGRVHHRTTFSIVVASWWPGCWQNICLQFSDRTPAFFLARLYTASCIYSPRGKTHRRPNSTCLPGLTIRLNKYLCCCSIPWQTEGSTSTPLAPHLHFPH